jgi:hypothetical protein
MTPPVAILMLLILFCALPVSASGEAVSLEGLLAARDDTFGGCSFTLFHVDLLSATIQVAGERHRLTTTLFGERAAGREDAALALGDLGHQSSVQFLEQALLDPESQVREAAILALSEIGGADAARALAFALGDADISLREEAVFALGDIGGEAAVALLQQALADDEEIIRSTAAGILAELSNRRTER